MQKMLYALTAISVFLLVMAVFATFSRPFSRKKKGMIGPGTTIFIYAALLFQLLITGTAFWLFHQSPVQASRVPQSTSGQTQSTVTIPPSGSENIQTSPKETTVPRNDPRVYFLPIGSSSTNPENFQMTWEISVDGEKVDSYTRQDPICFELDQDYFSLPGIATFRGSNYRDSASYGTAVIEEEAVEIVWSHRIGSLNKWGGCGWTGQPLLVQWDTETKGLMDSMYDSKKEKDGLVEVIYATLDGRIHFFDLEDGTRTRDAINMGMNFKGSGALDPRGYPLLYVGSGLYINGAAPRMFVVDLIQGKIIWEYGHDDDFALWDWSAFDSSPLVDAESDTLIWPGENGILYTVKLNTVYDTEAGTMTVDPEEPVKTRYTSWYSQVDERYVGYEASPAIVDHYLFTSEKGGLFQCVDLNTMELIWAQDIKDDTNSSPLFEWDSDGNGYLYTAASLHWTAEENKGSVSIYKLDAENGQIVWEYERECLRYDDIGGGIQSSPILGRDGTNIGGLVIYSISRTPSAYRGVLVALDKETGEKIWEISSGNYAWSSPVALYTEDGHAYIFLANASGVVRFIDGSTGEVLATLDLGETVEASPVAFGNMIVIGTREGVYGIRVS